MTINFWLCHESRSCDAVIYSSCSSFHRTVMWNLHTAFWLLKGHDFFFYRSKRFCRNPKTQYRCLSNGCVCGGGGVFLCHSLEPTASLSCLVLSYYVFSWNTYRILVTKHVCKIITVHTDSMWHSVTLILKRMENKKPHFLWYLQMQC